MYNNTKKREINIKIISSLFGPLALEQFFFFVYCSLQLCIWLAGWLNIPSSTILTTSPNHNRPHSRRDRFVLAIFYPKLLSQFQNKARAREGTTSKRLYMQKREKNL